MNELINQVRFSRSIRFFEQDFCKRWGVNTYQDINTPCFFAGVYREEDVNIINGHKGFKVIWNTGRIRPCFYNINSDNVVIRLNKDNVIIPSKYKTKQACFEIKDFSEFKPNIFGDKIYVYLGNKKGRNLMGGEIIDEIKKRTTFEVLVGYQGHNMRQVKENYYDKCFVNIKPSMTGGFTTAIELALMGRITISNSVAPFCKRYNTVDDILNMIQQESTKIGTVQPSAIDGYFDTGEEWKQVKFWQDE